jgi:hypothetical protein
VLGLITVPTLFLGGVALGLSLSLTYGMNPVLQPRHTLSLGPVLAIVLAAAVAGRWPTRVLAGCAAFVFGTTLVALLEQA